MIKSGIYTIRNNISGKIYIGSTVNIKDRWNKHTSELNTQTHGNGHLQNSWNKHGTEAFTFSVLVYCYEEDLIYLEQQSIDSYKELMGWDNIYNINPTAGSSLGIKRSPETIVKLRESHLGKKHTQEHRDKISKSLIGNTRNKGKPWSQARREAHNRKHK